VKYYRVKCEFLAIFGLDFCFLTFTHSSLWHLKKVLLQTVSTPKKYGIFNVSRKNRRELFL